MHNPIWLYWETMKNRTEPAYITLCRWTMLHNWSSENLIFLNSQNIENYLPGINHKIGKIEVNVKGRFDLLKRKIKPNLLNLAVKCDVYRANILNEYGGIYVDSSAIALAPLKPYFDLLNNNKTFTVSQRQSHGKSHNPVSFYGCKPKTNVIQQYCETINSLVMNKEHFHYNELGASALTPIVSENISEVITLNENEIMPITFEDADKLYQDKKLTPKDILIDNAKIFKLFNSPFKTTFSNMTINELYYSENFIGKLYREALPEAVFLKYCNREFNND